MNQGLPVPRMGGGMPLACTLAARESGKVGVGRSQPLQEDRVPLHRWGALPTMAGAQF